eukprot:Awhi_evm1s8130
MGFFSKIKDQNRYEDIHIDNVTVALDIGHLDCDKKVFDIHRPRSVSNNGDSLIGFPSWPLEKIQSYAVIDKTYAHCKLLLQHLALTESKDLEQDCANRAKIFSDLMHETLFAMCEMLEKHEVVAEQMYIKARYYLEQHFSIKSNICKWDFEDLNFHNNSLYSPEDSCSLQQSFPPLLCRRPLTTNSFLLRMEDKYLLNPKTDLQKLLSKSFTYCETEMFDLQIFASNDSDVDFGTKMTIFIDYMEANLFKVGNLIDDHCRRQELYLAAKRYLEWDPGVQFYLCFNLNQLYYGSLVHFFRALPSVQQIQPPLIYQSSPINEMVNCCPCSIFPETLSCNSSQSPDSCPLRQCFKLLSSRLVVVFQVPTIEVQPHFLLKNKNQFQVSSTINATSHMKQKVPVVLPLFSKMFLDAMTNRYSLHESVKNSTYPLEQLYLHIFFMKLKPELQKITILESNLPNKDRLERLNLFSYCFHEFLYMVLQWLENCEKKKRSNRSLLSLYINLRSFLENDLGIQCHFNLIDTPTDPQPPKAQYADSYAQHVSGSKVMDAIPFKFRLPLISLEIPDGIVGLNFLGDIASSPNLSRQYVQFFMDFLEIEKAADQLRLSSSSETSKKLLFSKEFFDAIANRYRFDKIKDANTSGSSEYMLTPLILSILYSTFVLCKRKLEKEMVQSENLDQDCISKIRSSVFSENMHQCLSIICNFEVAVGSMPIEDYCFSRDALVEDLRKIDLCLINTTLSSILLNICPSASSYSRVLIEDEIKPKAIPGTDGIRGMCEIQTKVAVKVGSNHSWLDTWS